MQNIPIFVTIIFVLTTFLTVGQFYRASNNSRTVLIVVSAWMLLQTLIGLSGFYQVRTGPPRFVFLIAPALIFTIVPFLSRRGRIFTDSFSMKKLTLLHSIRIPVEFTLYYVFLAKLIPELMTFEGRNLDIISGVTAPVVYYLVFVRRQAGTLTLLIWNCICLALLINVLTIAILSAQTPFQQLAFDQPNIGVTYFPYVWLPAVIVPIVLFSHITAIRQLIVKLKEEKKDAIQVNVAG